MSPVDRRGALPLATLLVVAFVLLGAAPTPPAAALDSNDPWQAERVRFESIDGEPLSVSGAHSYRGVVEVARGHAGLGAISEVTLDQYVAGISEVPNKWPVEALKAQAIAARTYALWQMDRDVTTEWKALGADICSTQACQVYTGLTKELADAGERWVAAVEATSDQVLLWDGEPIKAMYSSSNGGWSVAGRAPYLPSVQDPDDAHSPLHRWEATYPLSDVQSVWQLPGPVLHVGRAGHMVGIYYEHPDTGEHLNHVVAMQDFRSSFNAAAAAPEGLPLAIPSRRFELATVDGALRVTGQGYGHGMGMSQWGAYGKAARGMAAPDILASYYGGVRPTVLPAGDRPKVVRAAVATGRSEISVSSTGRFRVVDGDGRELAVVGAGRWTVVSAAGGVRVIPPADQAITPALSARIAEPDPVVVGRPAKLLVELGAASRLAVTATPPGDEPEVVMWEVHDPGPIGVDLPAPDEPGTYTVEVVADAGAGRSTVAEAELLVVGPDDPRAPDPATFTAAAAPTETGSSAGTTDRTSGLVAAGLLFLVGAALIPVAVRSRQR